jgi:hypothetical protein
MESGQTLSGASSAKDRMDLARKLAIQEEDKNKKANQDRQRRLGDIFSDKPTEFTVSGTEQEQTGALSALERAKMAFGGQNLKQLGESQGQIFEDLKAAAGGRSIAGDMIRDVGARRQGQLASSLAMQGVKGGAAARAVADQSDKANLDALAMQQNWERETRQDYGKAIGTAITNTLQMEAAGKNQGSIAGLRPHARDESLLDRLLGGLI